MDELIKQLRDFASELRKAENALLVLEAANAIEDLSERVDESIPKSDAEIIIAEVAKPRWIPVTERLPDRIVLAVNALRGSRGYHEQLVGYIAEDERSDSGYLCACEDELLMNVTHWMPLPEPPKEELG